MKLNLSYKFLNLILFLLFLVIVLFLFGNLHNLTVTASSDNGLGYGLLLLLMILGVVWFLVNHKLNYQEVNSNELKNAEMESQKSTTVVENDVHIENKEDKAKLDVAALIPQNCKTIEQFSEKVLQNLAGQFNILQGLMYLKSGNSEVYKSIAQYAYYAKTKPQDFKSGDTLSGQAVKNKTVVTLSNVPDNYLTIASGLGKSEPKYLVFVPLIEKDDVIGLIEYATFSSPKEDKIKALADFADLVTESIVKFIKK